MSPRFPGERFPQEYLAFETPGPQQNFFGYYDKSPMDRDGTRLLALNTTCRRPLPGEGGVNDTADVGFWSLRKKTFHKLADTRAFNWQQGAMLQWLGPDFSRFVIFNDRQEAQGQARFISRIIDTHTQTERFLPLPVYAVHPQGRFALSLDFERFYFPRRPYAYGGIVRAQKDVAIQAGDGIFRLDLETGAARLILETRQLAEREPVPAMAGATHYLEHMTFSPSGERFFFYHRFTLPHGGIYTRLYTARSDGEDLRLLVDSGQTTHAAWIDEKRIVFFGAPAGARAKLRAAPLAAHGLLQPLRRFYRRFLGPLGAGRLLTGSGYRIIADAEGALSQPLGAQGMARSDGHPTQNPAYPSWLAADTYQDRRGLRHLWLYNAPRGQTVTLGSLYSPPAFNRAPDNCDLHPRWDFSGRYLIVDSARTGARQMYVFDLARLLSS